MPAPAVAADEVLGRVTLVTGPEELLRERAVAALRGVVATASPGADLTETTGDQLTRAELENLAAPSLFATARCVVVRALEDTPDTSFDGVLAYAADPAADVALVLVHSGGTKGSGLLTRLRKAPGVRERRSDALKPKDLPGFVAAEVRDHRGRIDQEAADLLVQAVGKDLRALAGAAAQLTADFPEQTLTSELVGRYFAGRAEVKGFSVADHALAGRAGKALEELRWALESGAEPPAITGAFASSMRGLARVKATTSLGRGGEAELAREAGVPPWKVRALKDLARSWEERGLAHAITAVATADADVKGAGSDASYALERMVLAVCRARAGR